MTDGGNLALLTDFYQLTMAQSYFQSRKLKPATFSLFIRSYPPNRGYFVAAGLPDVLSFLEQFLIEFPQFFLLRLELFRLALRFVEQLF